MGKIRYGRSLLPAMLAWAMLAPWNGAAAHNIWVAQRAGEWALVLGEGAEDDAYAPTSVTQARALGADGQPVTLTLLPRERNLVLQADPRSVTLSAAYDDGYWSQLPDGSWQAGARQQHPAARKAGRYQMYTRTVLAAGAQIGLPLGLPLEIVPLADPLKLKRGEPLTVQVRFDGQPLANAKVIGDYLGDGHGAGVRTDSQGHATVVIGSSGLNVIHASHTVLRNDRGEADEDGHATTLTFVLPAH